MKRLRRSVLVLLLLAAGGYLIFDRIEAHGLASDIAAIAARGEPVRYEDAFPHPTTPEQRDAGTLYQQAAEAAEERALSDNRLAGRLDVDKPGGTELPLDDIVANYRNDAPALQLLDRATPLDFHGFDPDAFDPTHYEYVMQSLGSVACLRADLASARGDGEAAAAALVPCLRLQRTFVSSLDRSLQATRIVGSVRILLRHTRPSAGALDAMQRALDTWPDDDPTPRDVLLDRAHFIDASDQAFVPGLAAAIGRMALHPFVLRSARRALASYRPAMVMARQPWPERWLVADETERALLESLKRREHSRAEVLFDPFSFFVPFGTSRLRLSATDLAARRLIATVIAVERYRRARGHMPSSLDALVPAFLPRLPEDPFSGKPLLYKQELQAYVIYSVDTNRRDDGGVLYGFGAAQEKHVGPQSPRDFGVRVPLSIP